MTERLHFTFHFHALEKEMATHSSDLAWRLPGTGEPGGLPSMGSCRVGHDWSDLAAAAVCSVAQSCPTLCGPMGCSPPGSSSHGVFQARLLEWAVIYSFRGSSWLRDGNCLLHLLYWQADSLPLAPPEETSYKLVCCQQGISTTALAQKKYSHKFLFWKKKKINEMSFPAALLLIYSST